MKPRLLFVLLFVMPAFVELAAQPEFMPWGNLTGLRIEGQRFRFETAIRAVRADWSGYTQSSKYNWEGHQTYTRDGDTQTAEHALAGLPVNYTVRVHDRGAGMVELHVRLRVTAEADLAGLYFCLSLPPEFARGTLERVDPAAGVQAQPLAALSLPHALPGSGLGLRFRLGDQEIQCRADEPGRWLLRQDATTHPAYLNDPRPVQDFAQRDPQGRPADLQCYFPLVSGPVRRGLEVERVFQLQVAAPVDQRPVVLTLDPAKPGRPFAGIGGNFRLQFPEQDPAVIAYCLENLRVTWTRIAMYWREWHPEEAMDPLARAQAGRLSPLLQSQMELARSFAQRGLPVIVSVWDPPRWAADPWPGGERGEALRPEKLDAIVRSIADYLVHLRDHYGVEADLFSFNETDVGVEVRETPEMHARHTRVLGAAFAARGLRTKLLLGDTGHGTAVASRILGVVRRDPVARAQGGAVAFHTYHGCTPEDLQAWTEASRELGLPLMVTEGGPDSAAHRYPQVFLEPWFALHEIELYLRIAAACQPVTIMPWQLTADYSVLTGSGLYGDHGPLRPTQRFWNLKQLGDTPTGAHWIPLKVAGPAVTAAGWTVPDTGQIGVHLVNDGAAREIELRGMPAGVRTLEVRQTDATHGAELMAPVVPEHGVARFIAPAGAYLSLTGRP